MTQFDRIEAKLNWLRWQAEWGNLYSPSGTYMLLDPITHAPISDTTYRIPEKPKWPEDEPPHIIKWAPL